MAHVSCKFDNIVEKYIPLLQLFPDYEVIRSLTNICVSLGLFAKIMAPHILS